jgi:hypothetical protein
MTNGIGRVGWRTQVTPTTSSIITNGLVLNLDAGNAASYSGTGTTWTDLSGNGNNGTLVNGTGYSSSNGGTMVFDGINDRVSISQTINLGDVFTFDIWFKPNSYNSMISSEINYMNGGYIMYIPNSSTIYSSPANGAYTASPNMNLSTNTWVNISIVRNSTSYKWYKNGQLIGTSSIGQPAVNAIPNNFLSTIGSSKQGSYPFNGNISNIQVYNTLLSDSEISINFNALKSRYGL